MKQRISFLLIFLFSITHLIAEETIINASVENANGFELKIYSYSDFISFKEVTVVKGKIDSSGKVKMSFDLDQTIFAQISIGFQYSDIYLEPGKEYHLSVNYNADNQQISFLDRVQLDYQFLKSHPEDLNLQIRKFNVLYNDFLLKNFNRIYKNRQKNLVDTLINQSNRLFKLKSKYLENFIKYRIAGLDEPAGRKNKKNVYLTYFDSSPVLYDNIEYMGLFNRFYDQYLSSYSKVVSPGEIIELVNYNAGYLKLMDVLEKDQLLKNKNIRELVLLKTLYGLYYLPSINKSSVINSIQTAGISANSIQNRDLAKNILDAIHNLQSGTGAPDIIVFDEKGQNDSILKGISKKYMFINVWSLNCPECIREMDSIKVMYNKYGDLVEFVSISNDSDLSKIQDFKIENQISWKFRNTANSFDFFSSYKIRSIPAYIFIDQDGVLISYPAISPGKGFSNAFESILRQ